MSRLAPFAAITLAVLSISGCATPARLNCLAPGESASRAVAIVAFDQHAGLAIQRGSIPPGKIPELSDLPELGYVELGWGDADYYMDPDPGILLGLQALFFSSGSVIHAAAIEGFPSGGPGNPQVYEVGLSDAGFARMLDFVSESFSRAPGEKTSSLGPGWYGASRFFRANGHFSIFRTCNTWVAEALERGGCRFPGGKPTLLGGLRK